MICLVINNSFVKIQVKSAGHVIYDAHKSFLLNFELAPNWLGLPRFLTIRLHFFVYDTLLNRLSA